MNAETKVTVRERAGYFARWAAARAMLREIVMHLEAGRVVVFSNPLRATKLTRKHIPQLKATPSGFYIQNGKNWLCYDGNAVRVYGSVQS